jgi:hypothetical protein
MSEKDYPSLAQQGKNLAKFSWELINYIIQNEEKVLFVNDDVYKERVNTCKSCDRYDEFENGCKECGCYIPAKAKIILDSCPLNKWGADSSSWEEKFSNIQKDMGIDKTS